MELAKRSWPEIVAHIPRNLGSGETPLTEPSPSHLGFMLSHIRFDWLRFGCVAVGSFLGLTLLWSELPNESSRGYSSEIRENKYGEQRLTESKNIELMKHSATNCLLQLHTQVF
jgi:hypothetical protein